MNRMSVAAYRSIHGIHFCLGIELGDGEAGTRRTLCVGADAQFVRTSTQLVRNILDRP